MKWSPQQDQALKAVADWSKTPRGKPFFYLGGFAGTGKTTLAQHFAQNIGAVSYAAFTGKASLVLRSKGCRGAQTIHSLIYKTNDEDQSGEPKFALNRDSEILRSKLVIIDEVSMVNEDLGKDLLSFGVPVLVLGDPAQLPPVKGEGYFTAGEPDFMLTEVHRQAGDNPIIAMSMQIREGKKLQIGTYGESEVVRRSDIDAGRVLNADQVLVGLNKTRRVYNERIRELKGFNGDFQLQDRVVCLKNVKEKGLLNGGIFEVSKILNQTMDETAMHVTSQDEGMKKIPIKVTTHHAWTRGTERELPWTEQRNYEPFDYAYALTCHKSQGSQWDKVMVFDESPCFRDDAARWLYTAVTRAAQRVEIVL
ncbi:AAA family ATPase [Brucella sp. TWI432]